MNVHLRLTLASHIEGQMVESWRVGELESWRVGELERARAARRWGQQIYTGISCRAQVPDHMTIGEQHRLLL